jgi:hypothetical protein
MIASYGIITGIGNSVTTVIAWRHILIAFRTVGSAARTRSQRFGLNHARCTRMLEVVGVLRRNVTRVRLAMADWRAADQSQYARAHRSR